MKFQDANMLVREIFGDSDTEYEFIEEDEQDKQLLSPLTCDQCGKNYSRVDYLRQHVAHKHTNSPMWPCPYRVCDQNCPNKQALERHMATHFDIRSFHCDIGICAEE